MQLIASFPPMKTRTINKHSHTGLILASSVLFRWAACPLLTSSGSWTDRPFALTPPTRCWWEKTACTLWLLNPWPVGTQVFTPASQATEPGRTPSTWSWLLQVSRNKQKQRSVETCSRDVERGSTSVTTCLHSQRDAQGPFIRGEAAEYERGRGSSSETGVSGHRSSLPTDLLEKREWVFHSQHRQNQVKKTWNKERRRKKKLLMSLLFIWNITTWKQPLASNLCQFSFPACTRTTVATCVWSSSLQWKKTLVGTRCPPRMTPASSPAPHASMSTVS